MRPTPMLVGAAIVVASAVSAVAQPATEPPQTRDAYWQFHEANERYRTGQYAEAARGYEAIVDTHRANGVLYFNLGNAYAKAGRLGDAVWAYLNAMQDRPRDPDVRANLAFVASQLSPEAKSSLEEPPALRWLLPGIRLSVREWLLLGLLLAWLAAAAWLAWAWRPALRPRLTAPAVILTILAVLACGVAAARRAWARAPRAVVTADRVEARFAPQPSGTPHFMLHPGTVVRIRGREPGWWQVSRPDGRTGWVPDSAVRRIDVIMGPHSASTTEGA